METLFLWYENVGDLLSFTKHNIIVCRMRFSNMVELEDVEEAARLHREALKQSATDPLTGRVRTRKYLNTGSEGGEKNFRQISC